MPDVLDAGELTAYFALRRAGDRLAQAVSQQLRPYGLSEVQFSVLATLRDATAGRRMTDLASALAVSKSGLTYQIAQLEGRGLVERVGATGDERSVVARLTAAGERVIDEALPEHVALVRAVFLDLLDDEEVRLVGDVLGRVAQRLEARPSPGR